MTLELTAKCNFRCPCCYCLWHEYPSLAENELDLDGWKAILDKCAADGVDDVLFTGGEATLRADIFRILDYARRTLPGARLSLFTNASRLDESALKKFRRRRVHLATSLQGLATYGEMTGTRRRCGRLLSLIAKASELGWPFAVSLTVTRANMSEAADMFAAAALSGAEFIQAGPVMLGGRAVSRRDLAIGPDEWEKVKREIRSLPDARVPYTFCDEFACDCRTDLPRVPLAKREDAGRKPCQAGKAFGTVGPDGRYRTCLHALPKKAARFSVSRGSKKRKCTLAGFA
ncbi:MAG: radical SAM protein [Kiritimatiellae bacterium]|nr:radical SAM protein [Kiritimatiellia bacterium]